MTKQDLIHKLRHRGVGESLAEVDRFLAVLGEVLIETVVEEGEVVLPKVGRFTKVLHKERNGRNMHTGELISIPAKQVVKFRPFTNLKESVKNG